MFFKHELIDVEFADLTLRLQPSASKAPGPMTVQSGKQEGVSNSDTKHSTDIAGDPEKSQKPGGDPETAKSKGTIDPQPRQ